MEAEIKPVQSSMPLGKDEWLFVPSKGPQVTVIVERGHDIVNALWEQKGVGPEFFKSVYIDPMTREVRNTLNNDVEGYLYRGNHLA